MGVKYKWMGEKQESRGAASRIPAEQNPEELFPHLSSQGSCSILGQREEQRVRGWMQPWVRERIPSDPRQGAGVGMLPLEAQGSWIIPFRCPKSSAQPETGPQGPRCSLAVVAMGLRMGFGCPEPTRKGFQG